MVWIHFERDRTFRLEAVLFREGVPRLFQKIGYVGTQYRDLLLVQLHFEVWRIETHEVLEAVHEPQRVYRADIKTITGIGFLQRGAAFFLLTDAHEVDPENAH